MRGYANRTGEQEWDLHLSVVRLAVETETDNVAHSSCVMAACSGCKKPGGSMSTPSGLGLHDSCLPAVSTVSTLSEGCSWTTLITTLQDMQAQQL